MQKFAILACLTVAASPLAAETSRQRPESCVLIATSQDDHCAVTNHFRCDGAGPIAFWQEITLANGAIETHANDANHGAIEIVMPGGSHIRSKSSGGSPAEAVQTGKSRVTERATLTGDGASQSASIVIEYTFDGETRELAGKTFKRLRYEADLDYPQSGSKLHTSGTLLFNEQLDLLISETEVSDGQGGPGRRIKLKTLALEGRKGFGSTKPKYGCQSLSLNESFPPEVRA
ncbi:hypothetical protein [Neotabrizicola sp. sgz301269]|uniref:hypothetical protein n=1 Tax=Neotabrizicola sp. sgz301269 TaxID=3276282 RepID=UPI00376F6515